MQINNSSKKSFDNEYNNKIELPSDNMYIKPKWGLENINIVSITDEIHINKNEDIEYNYLFKVFNENKNKNIFFLILLPIIVITELFYNNFLFNYSLNFELNIQKYLSDNIIIFFRFITKAGCEYFIFISLIIIIFNFSLIKVIICFFGLTICIYIQSIMKMIYGNSRPFLENHQLFKGICDGGFGNPSGHALVSCYFYLILINYIINHKYFNDRAILKIILTLVFLISLILVILSRLILGLHSINQVIYGSLLGIWIFYAIIYIFKLDKISIIIYRKIYNNIKYIIYISLFFLLSILIPITIFFNFNKHLNYLELNYKLDNNCEITKKFRRFNYDGIFGSLIIISLIGFYIGQFLFWSLTDKYYKGNLDKSNNDYYLIDELINNWNKNKCFIFDKKSNIFVIIKAIFLCSSPLLLFISISPESNSMLVIFLFKFAVPLLLLSFLISGIGSFWLIILYCGNKENLINNYYQINIDDI